MLTKRIIPCLDIKDGKTVKGTNFIDIKEVGDPIELGYKYAQEGADELVFLDITATNEKRKTLAKLVSKIAQRINIPFTVGGGISAVNDVAILLNSGADKISVNSAAIKHPNLLNDLAKHFGNQCVVLAVDSKLENDGQWYIYLNGGRVKTEIKTYDWVKEATDRGAGEILLTSINHDGTGNGFAIEHTLNVSQLVSVPVIASGGAGSLEDFADLFKQDAASAALAAGLFHRNELTIGQVKDYLKNQNIPIR